MSGVYSLEDLDCHGIKYDLPSPQYCQYCKKPLRPYAIIRDNGQMIWDFDRNCSCQQSDEFLQKTKELEIKKKRRDRGERLKQIGIPRCYFFSEVSNDDVANYLENAEFNHGSGLYIYGPVGVGKTYLASAVAIKFFEAGYKVKFTNITSMISDIKTNSSQFGSKPLAPYLECDVLIIDDLGQEKASEWVVMQLYMIVNKRYEDLLPTIFTSQYSLNDYEKRLLSVRGENSGPAIISRMLQRSVVIPLTGCDRRRL